MEIDRDVDLTPFISRISWDRSIGWMALYWRVFVQYRQSEHEVDRSTATFWTTGENIYFVINYVTWWQIMTPRLAILISCLVTEGFVGQREWLSNCPLVLRDVVMADQSWSGLTSPKGRKLSPCTLMVCAGKGEVRLQHYYLDKAKLRHSIQMVP